MRTGEVTAVAPLDSLERPPTTSYVVVFLPSPICLSIAWGPLVSRRAEGGSQPGLHRVWATLASLAHVLWAIGSVRAGPASRVRVSNSFLFYSFHRIVYRFKNMYLLVGSFK